MAKTRLRFPFSRVVEFQAGERVISLFLFSYFFLITAPYYIIKPIRNSSYLEQLGDERLPLAYFLTAILMGFIVNLHSRLQVKLSRHRLVIASLSFFFINIILFWWLFRYRWSWVPVVFWVWANIFAIVLVTQFWILVNDVFNPREAKRLIGFIGSGGQLGAITGSLTAGALAKTKAASGLLLIAAAMVLCGIFIVYYIFSWRRQRQPATEAPEREKSTPREKSARFGFRDAFEAVKQSRYLKLLSGIVMVTLVVSTLIDWQFNSVVRNTASARTNLTSFFGYFNGATMAFAFLFQLLLTSNIIKSFGIRLTLLFYPLILLFCSAGIGIIAYASIIPAILIKASDKSLAYSLNQSVRELLYIPISPGQKYKSKIFIDMFLNRFGKGLGAVILAVLFLLIPKGSILPSISFVVLVFIVAWVVLNLRVSREYTNLVKEKLELKWERADRLVAEKMDVDYAKLVFDTLESKNRSSVLYAMHLFDLIRQEKLTPEVKKLISYKSDEIRAASLGTLFEQSEIALGPETEDELSEEVLKKDVQEIMALDAYQEVMKSYLEKTVQDKCQESEVSRMEAAKAIGLMDAHSPLVSKLDDLLEDDSPAVGRYAVQSAGALKRREDVPRLVQKLRSPALREDAQDALEKFGPRITGALADYLDDATEGPQVRKAVASVLGRIANQESALFLTWELAEAEGDLNDEIIDALDRIRAEKPDLHFPKELVIPKTKKEIRAYCQNLVRFYDEKLGGRETEAAAKWERNQSGSLSNIFRLLGLFYPHQDITKAYQNLKTGTKDSVAYAIELLDNVLEKEMRDLVFPLIEDVPAEERVRRCRNLMGNLSEERGPNG